MLVTIQPSTISGATVAPASKSSMQRACAAALLSKGITTILNPGSSNDDKAALDVITKLGASILSIGPAEVVITSEGVQPVGEELNCGESGLGIRMFTPIAATSGNSLRVTGTGSLLTRPMHFFDEIFPTLGISIRSNNGFLPFDIRGPLRPASITIDGSLSSQFLTGLLMAFGAAGAGDAQITVDNLKSKPYIDLTISVMREFGITVEHDDYRVFRFPVEGEAFTPCIYQVEGDWSGGAFLLIAGAVAGSVRIEGLDPASTQADKAILQALRSAGAALTIEGTNIECGPAPLKSFHFDATDCPDLFPPLVALAAHAAGVSEITGVSRLAHKESNRGVTLKEEFAKLGIRIDLDGDLMKVHGSKDLHGNAVHSRHDHRIAMACAVAALAAKGKTIVHDAEAI
ncbi:MAG TPA: 3-phosphoshikimate 1-carboxyvinyltransferase, partial [Flavitalea sp.]|nr:3-phosphoshikimate 1-carboxyvinyltransferase [Flavitalea sp.]